MEKKNNSGGKFFNGLLLGAAIGAGAFYLLGTEKGKKVLKQFKEQGLEFISEFDDYVEDEMDQAYMQDEFDANETTGPELVGTDKPKATAKPSHHPVKRLFKGAKKP